MINDFVGKSFFYCFREFKACFWKFCSWKSDRPHHSIKSVLSQIEIKQQEIEKMHREALKKQTLIDNEKKLKERNELKKLNELAHLFSRYY